MNLYMLIKWWINHKNRFKLERLKTIEKSF